LRLNRKNLFPRSAGYWGRCGLIEIQKQGIRMVSVDSCSNYRLARGANVLPCSLHDAARALQFVRSNAAEWNIDPDRIVVTGGSAGGCSGLWLAFHDDLADPGSEDPIARESTRVLGAAVIKAQSTINPWIVDQRLGRSASEHSMIWASVGASSLEDLLANWEQYQGLSLECSPLTHLSADDPPVFLIYDAQTPAPPERDGIHHAEFGRILLEQAEPPGLDFTMEFYGKETRQAAMDDFIRGLVGK
jgi:arylformamidase